ncbi:MAG: hypothetical protein WBO55_08190 [Rhizobiaceae bacterium]
MEEVREKAFFCVGRAVFFAALAITLVMLGLAFEPALALRSGAILGLVVCAVLIWFAQTAHGREPNRTETWLLLKPDARPGNEHGVRYFKEILHETYLYFAVRAFTISLFLLVSSIIATLLTDVPA